MKVLDNMKNLCMSLQHALPGVNLSALAALIFIVILYFLAMAYVWYALYYLGIMPWFMLYRYYILFFTLASITFCFIRL